MTIIEAIKSGSLFRRAGGRRWMREAEGYLTYQDGGKETVYLDSRDIMASDWEIEEPKAHITRSQFWDAAVKSGAVAKVNEGMITVFGGKRELDFAASIQRLAMELGL